MDEKRTEQELELELEDLKLELENFQKEKERVRKIVGEIGGVPHFNDKLINAIFVAFLFISVVASVFVGEKWRLLMIEMATVAISIKIMYLIHCQIKMNHFKFWMLSSIEWRINEVTKQVRQLRRESRLKDEHVA